MKRCMVIFLVVLSSMIYSQEFYRELPDKGMIQAVTKQNFPDQDAVIILKEQAITVTLNQVDYSGITLSGLALTNSETKIVKILNEAAVARYGSFEYTYNEEYGNDFPTRYTAKARVLKSSGEVVMVPSGEIKNIVSVADKNNEPLERKLMIKVPNLEVNDILQIQYEISHPFTTTTSGFFFYNDQDVVLYSNAYLTLPRKYEVELYSIPENKVGKPVQQDLSSSYGSGDTYFWSVKNCNSIPKEPFSAPFSDLSCMTGFIVKTVYGNDYSTWNNLAKNYTKMLKNRKELNDNIYEDLHIAEKPAFIGMSTTDSLYSTLKKAFQLKRYSSIYPEYRIDNVVESKNGDATDLAFIMYTILNKWKVAATPVLIRDRRSGMLEQSIPSFKWFDRMILMVTVNGQEKYYDFDEAIQNNFEMPWFLNGVDAFVVMDELGMFNKIKFNSGITQNQIVESHTITIAETQQAVDSLKLTYQGSFAENMRNRFYNSEKNSIDEDYKKAMSDKLFNSVEHVAHNDLFENSNFEVTVSGQLKQAATSVDSFSVFKLKENILSSFREKFGASTRKNDIVFDTPFRYTVDYAIVLPDGYEIKTMPAIKRHGSEYGAKFTMTVDASGNKIKLTGTLAFTQSTIAVKNFSNVIQLIENAVKAMNQEIVFGKK